MSFWKRKLYPHSQPFHQPKALFPWLCPKEFLNQELNRELLCHWCWECYPYKSTTGAPQLTRTQNPPGLSNKGDKYREKITGECCEMWRKGHNQGGPARGSPYMQFALYYRRQHLYKCSPLEHIRYPVPPILHSYMTGKSHQDTTVQLKQQPEDRHILIFHTKINALQSSAYFSYNYNHSITCRCHAHLYFHNNTMCGVSLLSASVEQERSALN